MSTTKRKAATGGTSKKPAPKKAPATKSVASLKKPAAKKVAAAPQPPPAPAKKIAVKKAAAPPAPPPKAPPPKPKVPDDPAFAGLSPKVAELLVLGREVLGIKGFRPGQAEAFEHIVQGRDVLAVMPTGSGKSLLYQLPSLVLPGLTVVVSPLIALIKDQVDKMVAKGVAVVRIDSTLTTRQRREMDALAKAPGGKLLLTTPERMADPEFREFLRDCVAGVGVSRFVVDEAHCVSQWGHDFRPAYLSLRKALEDVGRPPVLATTATAPPHVRADIVQQLGLGNAELVTTTFDRPNLHYEVINFHDEDEKMRTLVTLLKKLPRPGIVYCATVKKVEDLYEALGRHAIPVAKYHGRMGKNDRDREQTRFMDRETGKDVVMLATNAFGLGVDKKDIRNVLHYHVPGSLESYAQEAGRGGRDGKPTRCVLLFSPDDVAIQEYFLSGTYPTKRQVKSVYAALEAFEDEDTLPNVSEIALAAGVGQQRTRTVLSLLRDEGWLLEDDGRYKLAPKQPEADELDYRAKQYEARRIADRQRLDSLLAYVKSPGCRNQVILEYLGEPQSPRCGRCDNCLRSKEAALAAANEAAGLGLSVTRQLDEEGSGSEPASKPRRIIRTRTVRIDQPPVVAPVVVAAPVPAAGVPVRRRGADEQPRGVSTRSSRNGSGTGRNGSSIAAEAVVVAPVAVAPPVLRRAKAVEEVVVAKAPELKDRKETPAKKPEPKPVPAEGEELDDDDDLDDDDELDDDEDDLEGELDDDDLDDDDDDDDDLDDDEDDDDDDDDDVEEYEVIDKTAAELAEEGIESDGEITVLARKRVPKVPKPRPGVAAKPADDPASAEARRRRRRRRRKRRGLLPPKSAFMSPVMSNGGPADGSRSRSSGGSGGPVIEYVRGPLRINSAPVATATPNDVAGSGGRNGKGRRGGGGGGARYGNGPGGRSTPAERREQRLAERLEKKRRRRRRRRKNGVNGAAAPGADAPVSFFSPVGGGGGGGGQPNGGRQFNPSPQQPRLGPAPGADGVPEAAGGGDGGPGLGEGSGPIQLGPDGQPLPRKRRRRRRRGRRGRAPRNADGSWKVPPGLPSGEGGGGGDGGGGGPPPES